MAKSMLRATKELLDAQGFANRGFSSAEEFLIRGIAAQVDCLLLDIHLGGMSGFELRNQLKLSGSTLPVIFITALDDEDTRAQAHKAGCVAYSTQTVFGAPVDGCDQEGRPVRPNRLRTCGGVMFKNQIVQRVAQCAVSRGSNFHPATFMGR